VVGLCLLFLTSCSDPSQPDAVWCSTGTGKAQLIYPRAIGYSKSDDTYFIIDRMARVQHLDHRGQYLNEWRMPDFARGKPVGLSVGPDGNVYIADTHYARVAVYSPTGDLLRTIGSEGTAPGQFTYPTDVAFDAQGNIYVTEYGDNDRVQVFAPDGKFLRILGQFGSADGQFSRPQSLVIDGDLLYIADACNHRIAVFKTDGTFVRNFGSVGSGLGQFRFPYGLDQDSQGHLIVAEYGNNRVQWIDKETGRGLKTWGLPGREVGQLAYPWAVAVDRNDRVAIVDSGNNRVQVIRW
jgi:DNA-binding beta-propeller fold protein YncE